MSAVADPITYWGQASNEWGTSTRTTTDGARRNLQTEQHTEDAQQIVVVVTPQSALSLWPNNRLDKMSALSKQLPRVFLVEAPFMSAAFETAQNLLGQAEAEASGWRGIFNINAPKKVLFSETVEVRTETLRRLKPRIHIDRRTLERDDG